MKKSLLLFVCTILLGAANAQDVLTFDVEPVVKEDITAADTDVPGYSNISTTSTAPKMYKWVREELEISEGWTSAVCDRNNCYFPHVSEKEVLMSASNGSNLDVHVYPAGNEGCATIRLTVTDVDDPSVTATNMYHFNPGGDCMEVGAVSTEDKEAISKLKLFPNPVEVSFKVGGEYDQIHVVEVYNQLGQQIKSFPYAVGQSYDVADLAKGNYIVRLAREDASTIVSRLMHKM